MIVTPVPEPVDPGPCPLCGEAGRIAVFPMRDRMHRLPGAFAMTRCVGCGLMRLSPRPPIEELSYYYPSDYFTRHPEPLVNIISRGRDLQRPEGLEATVTEAVQSRALASLGYGATKRGGTRLVSGQLARRICGHAATFRLRGLPHWTPGGRALDVGAGNGSALALFQALGWSVAGLEPDREAAQAAQEAHGFAMHVGTMSSVSLPDASFDHVRLSHVLEHVPDPVPDLRRVARLLKPGGTVYIETPNAASLNSRRHGALWVGWDAPRHLQLFDRNTLKRAVEAAGLWVLEITTVFHEFVLRWQRFYAAEEHTGERTDRDVRMPLDTASEWLVLELSRRLGFPPLKFAGDSLCLWAGRNGGAGSLT